MGLSVLLPLIKTVIISLLIALPFFLYFQFGNIEHPKFRLRFAIWSSIMQLSATIVLVIGLLSFPLNIIFSAQITNKMFLHYWLIPIVAYLIVHLLAYNRPLVWRPGLVGIQYEQHGRLRHWNRLTRDLNERIGWKHQFSNHAVTAIKRMSERYEHFAMLSPAANYGDYEDVTARKVAAALGEKVYVYASDLATTNHIDSYEDDLVSFSYTEQVDARTLNTESNKNKFNLIFDIKGFLWYELNGVSKRRRAEEAMMMYYDLLKPHGIVIVDGYTKRCQFIIIQFNQMLLQFFKKIIWYAEPSTYSCMKKIYKKSDLLKSHFKEVVISDGIYTLVYYQKIDTAAQIAA